MSDSFAIQHRPYQKECLQAIQEAGQGRFLVAMATGLGKTAVFTHIKEDGRTLILSHRDELVHQPEKYYKDRKTFGVEKEGEHSNGEQVVSASVQTLHMDSRLQQFAKDDFDTIIIDECHHAAAPSYRKILDYFSGAKRVVGFTATPKRGDNVRLTDVFDKIVFSRDLKFGIRNGYLSRLHCTEVKANYNVNRIKTVAGDLNQKELSEEIAGSDLLPVAAKTYVEECAKKGKHTLVYCVSIANAQMLQKAIIKLLPKKEKDTVAVLTGKTPDEERADMLKRFADGKLKCIINCMVLTEGTDLPICDAVMNLRPTCNPTLYSQMAGRGTRLYPGKEYCMLYDFIPDSETTKENRRNLCSAFSLMGIDPKGLSREQKSQVTPETDLLDFYDDEIEQIAQAAGVLDIELKHIITSISTCADIIAQVVAEGGDARDLFRYYKESQMDQGSDIDLDFGNIAYTVQANEEKHYRIRPNYKDVIYVSLPDVLDNVTVEFHCGGRVYQIQEKAEKAVALIKEYCAQQDGSFMYSWNKSVKEQWNKKDATQSQCSRLEKDLQRVGITSPDVLSGITKYEASALIDFLQVYKDQENKKQALESIRASGRQYTPVTSVASDAATEAFVRRVHTTTQMQNKAKRDAVMRIERQFVREDERTFLPCAVEPFYGNGDNITPKQKDFINSLIASSGATTESLGGLNLNILSREAACFLISLFKSYQNTALFQYYDFPDLPEKLNQYTEEYAKAKRSGKLVSTRFRIVLETRRKPEEVVS